MILRNLNIFIIIISSIIFQADLKSQTQADILRINNLTDSISNNIDFVGPHYDGGKVTDTISWEEFIWSKTYNKMNDSCFFTDFYKTYKKHYESTYEYFFNNKPILYIKQVNIDSINYQIDYYISDYKILWINNDTLINSSFRKRLYKEVKYSIELHEIKSASDR